MKSCSTCASSLYSEVKYCPFCGTGTAPGARPKQAAAPVPPPAPAAAADAVVPESGRNSVPAQPVPAAAAASAAPAPAAEPARPAAQASAAGKNTKAAAPGQLPPAAPAATTPPPPPKSGKGKWIVIGGVLAALFIYIKSKPDSGELACNSAIELGNKALLAKDLAVAREQATTANGVCKGSAFKEAKSLQAAVGAAEKKNTGCQRSFRIIGSHLEEHKLASARTALNGLSPNCADDADATALRSRLSEATGAADSAQAALRTAIDNKDLAAAKSSLQALKMANRENPDLPGLKAEVAQLAAAEAAPANNPAPAAPVAAAPAPAPAPAPVAAAPRAAEPVRERTPARRSAPESAANPKAEMASAFLHDAETALAQKKFDAARTYVDSARRVDPTNPRLDSLTQQIRDRERQVLQQETIIR